MVKLEFRITGATGKKQLQREEEERGQDLLWQQRKGACRVHCGVVVLSMRRKGKLCVLGKLGVHQSVSRVKGTDAANTPVNPTSHIIFKCPTGRTVG